MKVKIVILIMIIIILLLISCYAKMLNKEQSTKDNSFSIELKINQPFRVTDDPNNQENAVIYDDIIVWQDDRNGNWDIYMFDLSTGKETRITQDPNDQLNPRIFENIIVWQDSRNQVGMVHNYPKDYNFDIYIFNISSGQELPITSNKDCQILPDIYDNKITWLDYRNCRFEVFMYDLLTNRETKISNNENNCSYCKIYGDKIIWKTTINNSDQIIQYTISSGETSRLNLKTSGWISGLCFNEYYIVLCITPIHGINADIYIFNFSDQKLVQITTNESFQCHPVIYGNNIFWKDLRNDPDGWHCKCQSVEENQTFDNWDIYMSVLTTNQVLQITSSQGTELVCDAYKNLVVYIKSDGKNRDVYLLKLNLDY